MGLVDFSHFDRITYYGATALTVSLAAITISKISFGVTLLRLTDGYLKMYVWFAIVTMAIFAIPAGVLPWILCKPLAKTFVDILPGTCINKEPSVMYARFQAGEWPNSAIRIIPLTCSAGWSALMDFSLAFIPWKILLGLQMRKSEKIGASIAMSLGLLYVVYDGFSGLC